MSEGGVPGQSEATVAEGLEDGGVVLMILKDKRHRHAGVDEELCRLTAGRQPTSVGPALPLRSNTAVPVRRPRYQPRPRHPMTVESAREQGNGLVHAACRRGHRPGPRRPPCRHRPCRRPPRRPLPRPAPPSRAPWSTSSTRCPRSYQAERGEPPADDFGAGDPPRLDRGQAADPLLGRRPPVLARQPRATAAGYARCRPRST